MTNWKRGTSLRKNPEPTSPWQINPFVKLQSTGGRKRKPKNIFFVEDIMDKTLNTPSGTPLYKIKWKDYDKEEATWEPAKNISKNLLNLFEQEENQTSERDSPTSRRQMHEMSSKNGIRKRKLEIEEDINVQVTELQSKVARLDDMNFIQSLEDLRDQNQRDLGKLKAAAKDYDEKVTLKLSEVSDQIKGLVKQNKQLIEVTKILEDQTKKLEGELEEERNRGFINYIRSFFHRKPKPQAEPASEPEGVPEQTDDASQQHEEAKSET